MPPACDLQNALASCRSKPRPKFFDWPGDWRCQVDVRMGRPMAVECCRGGCSSLGPVEDRSGVFFDMQSVFGDKRLKNANTEARTPFESLLNDHRSMLLCQLVSSCQPFFDWLEFSYCPCVCAFDGVKHHEYTTSRLPTGQSIPSCCIFFDT